MAALQFVTTLGRSSNAVGSGLAATAKVLQHELTLSAILANADTVTAPDWIRAGSSMVDVIIDTPDSVVVSVGIAGAATKFINAKTVSGGGILRMSEKGAANYVFASDAQLLVTIGTGGTVSTGSLKLTALVLPPNS